MKMYKVVYCFLNEKGEVETNARGIEQYHITFVFADNASEIKNNLFLQERFVSEVEIIEFKEVRFYGE